MNIEQVERIVALMGEFSLSEISLEQDGHRVVARRAAAIASSAVLGNTAMPTTLPDGAHAMEGAAFPRQEVQQDIDSSPVDEEPLLLTSPMVGLFHHAPTPIRYGVLLTRGQIVGAIESMKLMNDVQADQVGRVVDVLVEDGAPVEYGQPLFRVMPS